MTTLQKPFKGPTLVSLSNMPNWYQTEVPVYVSPDSLPLNRFYQVIMWPGEPLNERVERPHNIFENEAVPVIYCPKNKINPEMPSPLNFRNAKEYITAMKAWHRRMTNHFAAAVLPVPIMGVFYVPEPPKIFRNDEKTNPARFRTFKANQWPLLPNNYCDMISMTLNKEPVDPEAEFKEQIPKREKIYHKHHLTSEDQWMSQLIPAEPLPFLYETFEDYETAYRNWATMTVQSLKQKVMTPIEFVSIASMEVVEQSNEKGEPKLPPPHKYDKPLDLSWAPAYHGPESKLEAMINKLRDMSSTPFRPRAEKSNVISVLGVPAAAFKESMENYGVFPADPLPQKITRPIAVYTGRKISSVDSLKQMIMTTKAYDFNLVRLLLWYDLAPSQYDEIMQFQINRTKFASFLSSILMLPGSLHFLRRLSDYTPNYKYKVSYMLNSLFKNDPETRVLRTLVTQGILEDLDTVVSYLNVTSEYHEYVIPMVYGGRGAQTINRLYLLSVFMSIMRQYNGMKFYVECQKPCRTMSCEVAQYLTLPDFRNSLIMSPEGSEGYKMLLMLFSTNSKEIHTLLLGTNFIEWLSKGPDRRYLIATVTHSNAVVRAGDLLLQGMAEKKLDIEQAIKTISRPVAHMVGVICGTMLRNCHEWKWNISGRSLIPIFQAVAASQDESISCLLVPLASFICSKAVISDFNDLNFQAILLSKVVCPLCETLEKSSTILYREGVQALILLANDEDCCLSISRVPRFIRTLVNRLTDQDVTIMNRTWCLFTNMAKYRRVLEELLGQEAVLLSKIIDVKDNDEALKRFLEFSIGVWKQTGPICVKMCDVMRFKMGQISCLYKTRYGRFKDNKQMTSVINEYYNTISDLREPGTEDFLASLVNHMKADGDKVQTRSRSQTRKYLKSQVNTRPGLNDIFSG